VRTFLLKNKGAAAKTVIVQIPGESGYKLSDPKQLDEKSTDGLRFRVVVEPRKSREYLIRSETTAMEMLLISDLNFDQITGFLRESAVSKEMRAALQEVLNRRAKITALVAQRAAQESTVKDIEADQNRIRENMSRLAQDSALYKKYVAKLTAQEERVDAVREQIVRLRGAEADAQKSLRDFVNDLNVK
jgi:DNA repair ATPase RecN